MQTNNRILDDLARVAGGALSSLTTLGEEASARLREQVERVLRGMDLVRRDEFEAVRDMAIKARSENERLAARIVALEGASKTPAKAPGIAKSSTRDSAPSATARKKAEKPGPSAD